MTERQWLSCLLARPMLLHLRDADVRKVRHFVHACCLRARRLVTDERTEAAMDVLRRRIEGHVADSEIKAVGDAAGMADVSNYSPPCAGMTSSRCLCWIADDKTAGWFYSLWVADDLARWLSENGPADLPLKLARRMEERFQVSLIRDVFGNPFRAVEPFVPPPEVRLLARAAYEESNPRTALLDPVRLSILADALEEFGGPDEYMLAHLRHPASHWRGCWAVGLCGGEQASMLS